MSSMVLNMLSALTGKEVFSGTVSMNSGSINTGVTLKETDIFIAVPGNVATPTSSLTSSRTIGVVHVPGVASWLVTMQEKNDYLRIDNPTASIYYSGTNVIFSLTTTYGGYIKWYVIR